MTLGLGYDSAYPPTIVQANAAKQIAGPVRTWWGFYLPNVPNTDPVNTWTPAQMQVLVSAGFFPVPIVIPSPPHPADPVVTATAAYNSAKSFGLNPHVAVCYNGEHIAANGPVWLPIPGVKPVTVGSQSAVQYGIATIQGITVDKSVSAEDFPADIALVCDLEHNVQYTAEWYSIFQQTVATLAESEPMTPTDVTNITSAVQLMLREEFSPGSELYDRVVQAVIAAIQETPSVPPTS